MWYVELGKKLNTNESLLIQLAFAISLVPLNEPKLSVVTLWIYRIWFEFIQWLLRFIAVHSYRLLRLSGEMAQLTLTPNIRFQTEAEQYRTWKASHVLNPFQFSLFNFCPKFPAFQMEKSDLSRHIFRYTLFPSLFAVSDGRILFPFIVHILCTR